MTIGLLEKKLEGGGQIDPPLPCDRWENSPPEEGLILIFTVAVVKMSEYIFTLECTLWPRTICVVVWEKVPLVAQKLNWVNSIDKMQIEFLHNMHFFKKYCIPKLLLTNDGIAEL